MLGAMLKYLSGMGLGGGGGGGLLPPSLYFSSVNENTMQEFKNTCFQCNFLALLLVSG